MNDNIITANTMVNTNVKKLTMKTPIKKQKILDSDFAILKMCEYDDVKTKKYSVFQLKEICRFYKLKKAGNKKELIIRIYDHLKYSLYANKIQNLVRGHFIRKYIQLMGPAFKDRTVCINDTDFATLEPIVEIPFNQFFSFRDNENNIYGCDITSLYGLFFRTSKYGNQSEILNPYTRESINEELKISFSKYLKLAKINKIDHITVDEEDIIDEKKVMEFKILGLFQYINELGNYADSIWFTSLSRHMLVLFIREVYDIWNYRAQLSVQVMSDIVPPHGNPFVGMNLHLAQNQNNECLQKQAVKIIEFLVKSGHTTENRALGAYYVLAALTLVSEDARNALPWLFQSVAH